MGKREGREGMLRERESERDGERGREGEGERERGEKERGIKGEEKRAEANASSPTRRAQVAPRPPRGGQRALRAVGPARPSVLPPPGGPRPPGRLRRSSASPPLAASWRSSASPPLAALLPPLARSRLPVGLASPLAPRVVVLIGSLPRVPPRAVSTPRPLCLLL